MVNARRSGSDTVHVLAKAMAVLELLAEAEELSLSEISSRLDLNKSTCHRILSTLSGGDFVERSSPGVYRLGVGAFRVGSAMARRMEVRERSLPAMQELYKTTGETVFLCIARGCEAVCVERLDGRYASTHTLRLGGTLPLHVGAGPRVLLAARPDEEIEAYLDGPLERSTSATPIAPAAVWDDLRLIRREECAISRDDVELGVKAVGAPVRDHTGAVAAALSLSALSVHLLDDDEPRVVELVRSAAETASRALGYRSGGVR